MNMEYEYNKDRPRKKEHSFENTKIDKKKTQTPMAN